VNISQLTELSQSYFTTAFYRQSVRLGAKPLETNEQQFASERTPCSRSPYVVYNCYLFLAQKISSYWDIIYPSTVQVHFYFMMNEYRGKFSFTIFNLYATIFSNKYSYIAPRISGDHFVFVTVLLLFSLNHIANFSVTTITEH
jgi:hypothetical protein